jgi:hypothetical protein
MAAATEIDLAYLTFSADHRGYMLYYRGKPIGGAGTIAQRKPGQKRGPDARMFNEQARGAMLRVSSGQAEARFYEAIAKIDGELARIWPDAPRPGDYVSLGGERFTTVDHVCTYGAGACLVCDIHGVDYTVERDEQNDNQTRRAFKLAFPQAIG